MHLVDMLRFNWRVFYVQRVRTFLLLLAVTIGVASVVMLTSLGEGARRYVDREFSSLGNRLLIIFPGRNETVGGQPPIYGNAPRDLTLGESLAMARIPSVSAVAPVLPGTALLSYGSRSREAITIGTTAAFFPIRQVDIGNGTILPPEATYEALSICVLGLKLKQELFGNRQAVGDWLRIGDRRMRVVGVLADAGESLGIDLGEVVIIPVPTAQQIFNTQAMFRVFIELQLGADEAKVRQRLLQLVKEHHDGEDDVTIVSQDSVLAAFNNILTALTLVIAAIAAISLVVAGILIMNISLISVSQRRAEIGLLKAIGASGNHIRQLFLSESMMLVLLGSLTGILIAYCIVYLFRGIWPDFPLFPPHWAAPAAAATAVISGLVFSWLPARRAAEMDPVLAMRGSG